MDKLNEFLPDKLKRSVVVPALLWLVFCAGLILQVFSPHLAIEHGSFVIPADAVPKGTVIDPQALVQRQRHIQAASAVLVLVGAIGLGIWYREALAQSLSRK